MLVAIRKEENGFYIDKTVYERFSEDILQNPPYNFTKIYIDDNFADCESEDFEWKDGVFSFSVVKYNARKLNISNNLRIPQIKARLSKITEHLAQEQANVIVPNIEEEKIEFQQLLNEIRALEGKEPKRIAN